LEYLIFWPGHLYGTTNMPSMSNKHSASSPQLTWVPTASFVPRMAHAMIDAHDTLSPSHPNSVGSYSTTPIVMMMMIVKVLVNPPILQKS
jgi:hypothetical protein